MARIIYVEDDDLIGGVVQDILTAAGHLIGVVSHGTLGFETIAFKRPELVILDISLPGMTGIDIIKGLRRLSATHLTPILMLTAQRGDTIAEEALGAGANEFMTKPFSPDELVRKVGDTLNNNPFNRRKESSTAVIPAPVATAP